MPINDDERIFIKPDEYGHFVSRLPFDPAFNESQFSNKHIAIQKSQVCFVISGNDEVLPLPWVFYLGVSFGQNAIMIYFTK